jgi:RNA polymerase-binding protein DksA
VSTSIPHTGSISIAIAASSVSPVRIAVAYDQPVETVDLETVRAALLAERSRLREDRDETITAPDQMTYGSQAAAASQVFAQQRDLALRDRAEQQLALVDAALERLAAGTFGTCVRCGNPIHAERLEALPWAPRCIDCQRLADRER